MFILKCLYKNFNYFQQQLLENKFDCHSKCILEIYTAEFNKEETANMINMLNALLPNAQIFGTSTCAIIYNGKQYEDQTLIIIKQYENAKVVVSSIQWENKSPEELVEETFSFLAEEYPKMINIVFSDHYEEAHYFVEEFNQKNTDIKLAGGVAGDVLLKNIVGYVFTHEGIIDKGIVLRAVYGEEINAYIGVNIALEPISPTYTITETDNTYLTKIDNVSAVEWFQERLGIYEMKEYGEWKTLVENDPLVRFQLVLEGASGISRAVRFDKQENKISLYFNQLPPNTKFKIGYISPNSCVQRCYDICNEIVNVPIESLFCYSCLFRKLYMGNCAEWEISPFAGYDVCGVFMFGEIGYVNGRNEYLNGSSVLIGEAERINYIVPSMKVFEDLRKIEDENKELLAFVLRKQSEVISQENQKLLTRLVDQQEVIKINLQTNPHFGMSNLIKYKDDNKEYNFDKLCMIKVDNADVLISCLGQDGYFHHLNLMLGSIKNYIIKKHFDKIVFSYVVNNDTFIIVAKKEIEEKLFLRIVNKLYRYFQFIKPETSTVPVINRFVVVLHREDMIECAMNALHSNKNAQAQYIVCDQEVDSKVSSEEELQMLTVLNRAIQNNAVVPYYQGIYDNREKCINKYEALMRLVDEDGKVYLPFSFMNIAKKYHLYTKLSEAMIERVINDFADRDESVSINLSAYDINSKAFKGKLFGMLSRVKNAASFVFEILEDEGFRDVEVLKDFILEARLYGAKIAIDDFGSGYSNLLELVKVTPDFIKVDGGIIKEIHIDVRNRVVLETIIYLAKKLNAFVVAEYVENEEIQKYMEEMNIHFSQGYYFARPTPFNQLKFPVK